ncbi:hypothetical protein BD410DRAFT_866151 [Rickenella mellea]|uniref:C2 domain-containing protein n=1 Tax=Rickenella mellea TaxID=50990 RepID=A0A4Y7Q339_9AGAM|nr:hypothetical protein BD410DRAFT_866151 [Rickenella mellea]
MDDPEPKTVSVVITIVGANGLFPKSPKKAAKGQNVFVKLKAPDASPRQTPIAKGSEALSWGTTFPLVGVETSARLVFKVVRDGFLATTTLGSKEVTVSELLDLHRKADEDITLSLHPNTGTLTLRIREEDDTRIVLATLTQTQQTAPPKITHPNHVPDPGVVVSRAEDVCGELADVVGSLEKLVGVVDSFASIHPYVNAAWQTVSLVYKVVQKQLDRDGKILSLVTSMKKMYSFVDALDAVKDKHKILEGVIKQMMKQTIECALFIQEYSGHGFAEKAIVHSVSTTDAKIAAFNSSFDKLAKSFDTGVAIQTTLVSFRTSEGVDKLVLQNALEPAKMDWSNRPLCLPKTRLAVTKFVTEWVTNASGENTNVLWLWGVAGSGKSTLSTSIAAFFADINRLGAFVFFSRDVTERSNPFVVVRTLAHQLACFDSRLGREMQGAIERNSQIAKMHISAQFRELVRGPLESVGDVAREGPVVVVIDALDECGTTSERESLLAILAEETAHLPKSIRIIVMSRAEPDIDMAFRAQKHVTIRQLGAFPDNVDIPVYIEFRLKEIASKNWIEGDWPGEETISELVKRTAGLFIWASTACHYIDGYNPEQLVVELVQGKMYQDAEAALDALYVKALQSSGDWTHGQFKVDCCAILGLVLVAKDPLSPGAIDKMLGLKSQRVISKLRSVLLCEGPKDPVRILHVSFRDFLSNRERCKDGPWFIDIAEHNYRLAELCIKRMNLAFKEDIFPKSLDDPISPQVLGEDVAYACTHWIFHVCEIKDCPETFSEVLYGFLSINVLHWLEAMSMLGKSRNSSNDLERLRQWVNRTISDHEGLIKVIYGAYRFSGFFANTIAEHPWLVYSSALAFAPITSTLYRLFHHDALPAVLGGYQQWWSPSLKVLRVASGNSCVVDSVMFSPDGNRLVSYGKNKIRIWNVRTGTEAIPAIDTPASRVFLAFSPDGLKIRSCSGDGTIEVLDAKTGRELITPLRRDQWALDLVSQSSINRAAFSPDGSTVVMGSEDGMVHVVDITKGKELYAPIEDSHGPEVEFTSIDVSPDNTRFASCSGDRSICVRSVQTGTIITKLQGHSDDVKSVKFCSDGLIMSSSLDRTVRTWDAATGEEIHSVSLNTTRKITPKSFSDDGLRMAASSHGQIEVWDTNTGEEVCPPIKGHFHAVWPVVFTPDKSVALSGACGETLQLWAVVPGKRPSQGTQRHTVAPDGIAFSPDGLRVRSYAADGTRFWDTASGRELKMHPHDDSAVFATDSSAVISSDGKAIQLRDAETGEDEPETPKPSPYIPASPGNAVLTCTDDGAIQHQGKTIWRVPRELNENLRVVRGRLVAIGTLEGQIFVVHLPSESAPFAEM